MRKKIYIYYIHLIFNPYQQYRHSMVVPSVTNAQGQVSVIQMQWSPEAGDNGTFDQANYPETELIRPESFSVSMTT